MHPYPGFMALVTWVKFLGEKLKATIPLEPQRRYKSEWWSTKHESVSNNGSHQGCKDTTNSNMMFWFFCTHPQLSTMYRKLVNWYKRIPPVQTSFFEDQPHGRCSFNFWFGHFHLPGSQKICISFVYWKVEMYWSELHEVRDPNMPATND